MAPKLQLESLWCSSEEAKSHLFAVNLEIKSGHGHGTTELMEKVLLGLGAHYLTTYPAGENCDIVLGHCRILPQLAESALLLISDNLAQAGIFPMAFRINTLNS